MATSGTYTFDPEVTDFVSEGFERCGIDPASLTARHARSARMSLGFLFSDWSNDGVHLWTVDQQSQVLTQSDGQYNAPTGTIAILEMFVRRDGLDTPVFPMARDEYMAIPDKTMEGMINRFYFERSSPTPTITFWPYPENSTDTVYYYRMRRFQDVGVPSNTLDIPDRWQEALASGMAAKLAVKYSPDRVAYLEGAASKAFAKAKREDRERTPTTMQVRYNTGLRRYK